MIITVQKDVKNNEYIASISTEVNSIESRLMDAFGEPQIDVAGVIPYTNNVPAAATFTIGGGPNLKYVRGDTPLEFKLSSSVDPLAQNKVKGWADTIKDRITTAMAALKAQPLTNLPDTQFYEA